MKIWQVLLAGHASRMVKLAVSAFVFASAASAADLYVVTNGTGDGSSWANATNSLQGAIDAISAAYTTNTVWVSNGVYETGGVTNYPSGSLLTNRVAIWKAITVRSANNDPANTIIKGAWVSDGNTNGVDAVRCVYMADNSSLIGFMITNGATLTNSDQNGGGVKAASSTPIISNCVIAGNSAVNRGGGAHYGTYQNCTFNDNSAYDGGAAYAPSSMTNCAFIGNSARNLGGGASGGALYDCTFIGNTALNGGGAQESILFNCTVVSNNAISSGGGIFGGTLYNCTIIGNVARGSDGGGTYGGTIIYNCAIDGNEAGRDGGGISGGTLYNCTVVGNKATRYGGGAYECVLYNSIIYFNDATSAGSNWYGTVSFTNCCTTTAQVGWAAGNITNDPMFIANGSGYGTNHVAGNYRLSNNSPCINAGLNQIWMTNAYDLDGYRRVDRFSGIVDIGAYEHIFNGIVFRGF